MQRDPRKPKYEDLTGVRFGLLTAISYEGRAKNSRNAAWLVRCDCGVEKVVKSTNLKRQQSCGCLLRIQMSERTTTHGLTRPGQHHPLYTVWDGMKRRCHGSAQLDRYGGRGITVCHRWRFGEDGLTGFECFLDDMGPRPPGMTIDRIDNDDGYHPGNCRWATIVEQQRNRSSNRNITFNGREMTLTEAIEITGINEATVWGRLNLGWSVESALTTPVKRRRNAASAQTA